MIMRNPPRKERKNRCCLFTLRFNETKEMKRQFWGVHLALGFVFDPGTRCFVLFSTTEIEMKFGDDEKQWSDRFNHSMTKFIQRRLFSRDWQSINWWKNVLVVTLAIALIFLFIAHKTRQKAREYQISSTTIPRLFSFSPHSSSFKSLRKILCLKFY